MTELGLLCLVFGGLLALQSLLATLTDDSDGADNFAANQERAWATVGPKLATTCIAAGLIITLIGVFL